MAKLYTQRNNMIKYSAGFYSITFCDGETIKTYLHTNQIRVVHKLMSVLKIKAFELLCTTY